MYNCKLHRKWNDCSVCKWLNALTGVMMNKEKNSLMFIYIRYTNKICLLSLHSKFMNEFKSTLIVMSNYLYSIHFHRHSLTSFLLLFVLYSNMNVLLSGMAEKVKKKMFQQTAQNIFSVFLKFPIGIFPCQTFLHIYVNWTDVDSVWCGKKKNDENKWN